MCHPGPQVGELQIAGEEGLWKCWRVEASEGMYNEEECFLGLSRATALGRQVRKLRKFRWGNWSLSGSSQCTSPSGRPGLGFKSIALYLPMHTKARAGCSTLG